MASLGRGWLGNCKAVATKQGYSADTEGSKHWLYLTNNESYSTDCGTKLEGEPGKTLHFLDAVVKNIRDPIFDKEKNYNYYNHWKLFIHPSEKYLPEVFEAALKGLKNINVEGKVAINEKKMLPSKERIIFYINRIWYPRPQEFFDAVLKLFPENYQKEISNGLESCKEQGFITKPKPAFTKSLGSAIYIRQGGKEDRINLINARGDINKYFEGECWYLLRNPRELSDVLGKPIKEVLKKKADVQKIFDKA